MTRPGESLRARLVRAATQRLGLKAASLFFAGVLWVVVSSQEPTEELVPVRFAPILDSSLVMRGQLPVIRALVIGRAQEVLKLYQTPPVVRHVVLADTPDEVTVQVRVTDVELPAGVTAIVRDIRPREITLRFDSTLQRVLPVESQLRFTADTGWVIDGAPRIEPDSVLVIGHRRAVARLLSVPTVPTDLLISGTGPVLVPLDTSKLGVRVRPATVRVVVPVRRDPSARGGRTR